MKMFNEDSYRGGEPGIMDANKVVALQVVVVVVVVMAMIVAKGRYSHTFTKAI